MAETETRNAADFQLFGALLPWHCTLLGVCVVEVRSINTTCNIVHLRSAWQRLNRDSRTVVVVLLLLSFRRQRPPVALVIAGGGGVSGASGPECLLQHWELHCDLVSDWSPLERSYRLPHIVNTMKHNACRGHLRSTAEVEHTRALPLTVLTVYLDCWHF